MTTNEIPAHSHDITDPGHSHPTTVANGESNNVPADGEQNFARPLIEGATSQNFTGITINQNGGGLPHENMPPYYALAYIMRIS